MAEHVDTVDIVVVGLGVGGEEVAGRLAEAGLRVVGVEGRLVGGECPYWGCVPSKMMIRAGNALAEARRVPQLAGTAEVRSDWAPVARRIREEATDSWDDKVAVDRLVGKGVTFVRGWASITGPGEVTAGDRVFRATRGIVLGTGTEPAVPPIDGLAGTPLWTNREAIEVETLPASLIVLGGGAIGVELAQVFARFGVAVTVVEAADRLVALEEPESSDLARAALTRDGVTVHVGVTASAVHHDGDCFTVSLSDGGTVTAERLLVATGRKVDLSKLGVDRVGLDPAARAVTVDERMRAADGVWAVGDVTGHGAFTHMAMYQAGIAVRDILGQDGPPADYRAAPRVTFTDPEIGAVGLTEAQARAAGLRVRTGTGQVPSSSRGWIHKAGNEGFIKLVEDADRGVLVGATSAGPVGGEVLSALAVAVHAEVPVETLRHMIYAYPTFHRGIEDALRDLNG
ncbi:NAD(P)/FAD-dependent oxidoreductase [Dactylosporangium aurantiacum]|uniref:NAD(P)/FAD-dependent oxidoreductase n=1 Tax=Dactylosporangium aurantiacum TaxID=35754 RepID=A0A9Q9MC28_9ACTN|nr:NAD(P)/FAD-dependent oxidoreductase [Dactylosporangium aurantiacum]MDG6106499.1 NAD(P)/FAD-dependent oxidoreductase [Dactylosporangium aurantiacum]UWZ50469.1 NAD(P)/FAD-dependent oxidoreductase [Dactylosporangium aurantiacum]